MRCPGQLTSPEYDPETNGSASITLAIIDNKIQSGASGNADNCLVRGEPRGRSAPGQHGRAVRARPRPRRRPSASIGEGGSLLLLAGSLDIGGLVLRVVSARWTVDNFEYLFELPDGTTVVAELSPNGIGVRDRDVTWTCPDGQPCALQ